MGRLYYVFYMIECTCLVTYKKSQLNKQCFLGTSSKKSFSLMFKAFNDDVTGPQQRCNPTYIPHIVEHIKVFLSKAILTKY